MLDHGMFTSAWNPTALYVEPCFNGKALSNASSFLWAHEARVFLVTNWHVLSGCNALTGKVMHPSGGIPNEIKIYSYRRIGPPLDPKKGFRVTFTSKVVSLADRAPGVHKWLQHPTYGPQVDVAALDVTEVVSDLHHECVNRLEGDRPSHMDPGDEVFIVGYPFGLIKGAWAPIWKRGSIALDPGLNPDGLPKMLVDTATREGMSGSVVIAMFPVPEHDTRRGDDPRPIYLGKYPAIIGVYSGRHYPDLERAQLGIVWKRETIEEVVSKGIAPRTWPSHRN